VLHIACNEDICHKPVRFLEEELARRYREAAPHVLTVLQDRVEAASRELLKSDSDLKAAGDVSTVRATGKIAVRMQGYLFN
jgi:hypothetical protein